MTVKETFQEASRNDITSLSSLIMFLVFEKKVLTMEDDAEKLDFYFQKKFHKKMNEHLIAYQAKMNIHHKPFVYCITDHDKERILYVKAPNKEEAVMFVKRMGYEAQDMAVEIEDIDVLKNVDEKKGLATKTTLFKLRDETKDPTELLAMYEGKVAMPVTREVRTA